MIKVKKGDKVKLEKISDDKFAGFHPNGIQVGFFEFGELVNDVVPEKQCLIVDQLRRINTSIVTQIIDETTFKTKNSTYNIILRSQIKDGRIIKPDSKESETVLNELNNVAAK